LLKPIFPLEYVYALPYTKTILTGMVQKVFLTKEAYYGMVNIALFVAIILYIVFIAAIKNLS